MRAGMGLGKMMDGQSLYGAPKVSVLMTIYNAEPYLKEAIDSIVAQTFDDWELIAIENGSSDGSPAILAGYNDERIRIFSLPKNIGRTPALQYALDQARGDYIAVLDADDVSHPGRLAKQAAFLDEHTDVALVGSWAQYIDDHSNIFAEFTPPVIQQELQDSLGWINPIVHSSAMYRHQLALDAGGYPEEFIWAQDFGLILALAQHSKVAMIDDFLCQLRVLATSMTRSRNYQVTVANETLILFKRAAELLLFNEPARRLNRRAQAIAEIKLGVSILMSGSVWSGLGRISCGMVSDPSALWANGRVRRLFKCGEACWLKNV